MWKAISKQEEARKYFTQILKGFLCRYNNNILP